MSSSLAELDSEAPISAERNGLALRARVLPRVDADRLLGADVTDEEVVPIIFALTNGGGTIQVVEREDFRLRLDGRVAIEPALPGRAASLLRDSSDSEAAAMAGFIVFGALAAPVIHAADRRETAAAVAKRDHVFARAELQPGATQTGYLLFESPRDPAEIGEFRLELYQIDTPRLDPIVLSLPNPYRE